MVGQAYTRLVVVARARGKAIPLMARSGCRQVSPETSTTSTPTAFAHSEFIRTSHQPPTIPLERSASTFVRKSSILPPHQGFIPTIITTLDLSVQLHRRPRFASVHDVLIVATCSHLQIGSNSGESMKT
ncbi:hypothetical protein CRG98_015904 [Punica granatum]|uniref:Uncharacterized protein n=1 Tax=Punica granatum TaxID=22663 RepID=A0A2I0K5A0_PUNGR|nr:hypothetical protein CRG98_015904 [Punica granatum]